MVHVPLPHLHTSALVVKVRGGPRFETPETAGLSHLVEHMLIRGTRRHPSTTAFQNALARLGAEISGESSYETVSLEVTVPAEHTQAAAALLEEAVNEPLFAGLDVEREIVLAEINETLNSDGAENDAETLVKSALWAPHPAGLPIAGTVDLVTEYTLRQVVQQHRRLFTRENGVFVVAGPTATEVTLPPGPKVVDLTTPQPNFRTPVTYVYDDDSQVTAYLAFPFPVDAALEASWASTALGGGFASRLHQAVADRRGLAYTAEASVVAFSDFATLDVEVTTAPEKITDAVYEAWATIADFTASGFVGDEFARVHALRSAEAAAHQDDPSTLAHAAATQSLYGTTDADTTPDPDRVIEVARSIFAVDRPAIAVVGPIDDDLIEAVNRLFDRTGEASCDDVTASPLAAVVRAV